MQTMVFTKLSVRKRILFKRPFVLTACLLPLICVFTTARPSSAGTIATLVDLAGSPTTEGLAQYLQPVEWTAFIDPSQTNWMGLHHAATPNTHSSLPGREYIGGAPFVHWIGLVNDFLNLTITNLTTNESMTRRMDYNDPSGNESGTQSVIFGSADVAPDVHRLQDPFGSRNWVTFDEAGAFNSFFQTAAHYQFRMTYGNTGGGSYSQDHDNIYFLVDVVDQTQPVPEPSSAVVFAVVSVGLVCGASRRRRIGCQDGMSRS
jgi:hypothetical protein